MEVQEEITHTYQCAQTNEHIQCSQCGTMHRSSVTTPITFHSLLLFVTNMFNTLFHPDIYEGQDAGIITQQPTTM